MARIKALIGGDGDRPEGEKRKRDRRGSTKRSVRAASHGTELSGRGLGWQCPVLLLGPRLFEEESQGCLLDVAGEEDFWLCGRSP
ncbi:hypothetical protein FQA47_022431 [Oryzias melastigma]|uniref:Uncharacterized protein n=1 Tax=Oryzias melastigma TaxID=30732 RepID=A0A834FQT6_ORYME|nr:hypothetical protein FQA47_022431 [Oryzias melastigma]